MLAQSENGGEPVDHHALQASIDHGDAVAGPRKKCLEQVIRHILHTDLQGDDRNQSEFPQTDGDCSPVLALCLGVLLERRDEPEPSPVIGLDRRSPDLVAQRLSDRADRRLQCGLGHVRRPEPVQKFGLRHHPVVVLDQIFENGKRFRRKRHRNACLSKLLLLRVQFEVEKTVGHRAPGSDTMHGCRAG